MSADMSASESAQAPLDADEAQRKAAVEQRRNELRAKATDAAPRTDLPLT